ncbi:DUF4917 family protein [Candidatus Nucleicultrix amoebiphila]|jgi:hypothetical protein|uniref:SIR2-like domain-containing protein n=1 Tax=Candidatus Nucleicultrix amoebiphila FS5 TaxID=1414854 RepID=A0A1W6N6J1_9PROT|nr:DUF4917 family protein [Candidatus Nucleicultrix amoebiphila]ARN85392.1 hypothetical protein GQ61_08940 [Candidatus Nucleicultrix amoebiphila FS5]
MPFNPIQCTHIESGQTATLCLSCYIKALRNGVVKNAKKTLLIGNGLGLSCPADSVRNAVHYDTVEALDNITKNITNLINAPKALDRLVIIKKPELINECVRYIVNFNLLNHVLKRAPQPSDIIGQTQLKNFFLDFNQIFTINYDPFFFWTIQKYSAPEQGAKFLDGLTFIHGNNLKESLHLTYDEIATNLQNGEKEGRIPVYFLHGGFHLRKHQITNKYFTISAENWCRENFMKAFKDDTQSQLHARLHNLPLERTPVIIFEDRYYVKKAEINDDHYLREAYKKLSDLKQGHLFIYGCSFFNCEHLFEAIFHSPLNPALKIYISYMQDDTRPKKFVMNYLHSKGLNSVENIYWVEIKKGQERLIWKDPKTDDGFEFDLELSLPSQNNTSQPRAEGRDHKPIR